jgi:DNA-binding NtrC family response regulator
MTKILVIDDDAVVRTTIEQILEVAGYQVLCTEDGVRGMAVFRNEAPDLIITDVIMPEQEDIQTITEMRKEKPDAKIIAISGGGRVANTDFLRIARALGAIAKPFDADEFLTVVKNCLAGGARDGNPGHAGLLYARRRARRRQPRRRDAAIHLHRLRRARDGYPCHRAAEGGSCLRGRQPIW